MPLNLFLLEMDGYVPGAGESKQLAHLLTCVTALTGSLLVGARFKEEVRVKVFNVSLLLQPQELVPSVEMFLSDLLQHWNGEDYGAHIFKLLSHLPLQSFSGMCILTN